LTKEEIQRLRTFREQIIARLEASPDTQAADLILQARRQAEHLPLTFSQLSHWDWYQLGERRSVRVIASAMRLCGPFNIDSLQRSIAEVIRRHEALRTHIVVRHGVPSQEVAEQGDWNLTTDDLTTLPEPLREKELRNLIEREVLEPVDVTVGPLLGMKLVKLRVEEHVLIVAMEHVISDMFSMSLFWRELLRAYAQAAVGRPFSLPEVPIQFADYALWRRQSHESWLAKHGRYWNKRLSGCQRVMFPSEGGIRSITRVGWGTASVRIGRDLKAKLLDWCRVKHTTLAMAVLTAYTGLVLRWCAVSDVVVQLITDGRVIPKIENTIGYFAFPLSLRIELLEDDRFIHLLSRVTTEYCNAHTHSDYGYIEAQTPRPEFVRNTAFNWIPNGSNSWMSQVCDVQLSEPGGLPSEMTCVPVPFEHPVLKILDTDREPFILLFDTDEEVVGGVHFPLSRFGVETMERFVRNFHLFVSMLTEEPAKRLKDMPLLQ
jgi:hypothetical protein